VVVKAIAAVIAVVRLQKKYNLILFPKNRIDKRICDNHNPVLRTVANM
jgi:hypothetical protein